MQDMNHPQREQALQRLKTLYAEIDSALDDFGTMHPHLACPQSCHRCCTEAAPLVSELEFVFLRAAFEQLEASLRQQVLRRAQDARAQLEASADDRLTCPLLHQGRCLVYAQRPYLCRSFGHSRRPALQEKSDATLYTCPQLRPQRALQNAPVINFRLQALRERNLPLLDSYLPIWLSTTVQQRRIRWLKDGLGIVTASS